MREEEATPTIDQGWIYVILGIKEPLGLPPKNLM
jgi:hypothetical protein